MIFEMICALGVLNTRIVSISIPRVIRMNSPDGSVVALCAFFCSSGYDRNPDLLAERAQIVFGEQHLPIECRGQCLAGPRDAGTSSSSIESTLS